MSEMIITVQNEIYAKIVEYILEELNDDSSYDKKGISYTDLQ